MRKGISTEYLSVREGERVSSETLADAIKTHPDVKTVVLFWTWSKDYFTSSASVFEAYVSENTIDEEYSFFGDREDALKFADSYDCWDGQDFIILKGDILYGYCSSEDYQTSWSDGYDHSSCSPDYDPSWFVWLRVDFDYATGTEYLLSPDPIPEKEASE